MDGFTKFIKSNLLTILILLAGFISGWTTLKNNAEQAKKEREEIKSSVTSLQNKMDNLAGTQDIIELRAVTKSNAERIARIEVAITQISELRSDMADIRNFLLNGSSRRKKDD